MTKSVLTLLDSVNNNSVAIDLADAGMIILDKNVIRIHLKATPTPTRSAIIAAFFSDMDAAAVAYHDIITRHALLSDDPTLTGVKVIGIQVNYTTA
jgi:hypothetical protein